MLFTIIESFSPKDGDAWTKYCAWRGITFERFDSIDGILRPSLFNPQNDADWHHVVAEDFMNRFIKDIDFALATYQVIGQGDLVGVRFNAHDERDDRFLGYDLIDGYCDVSLLTNWGMDKERVNRSLAPNALVPTFDSVRAIQEELTKTTGTDSHVKGCRIVSVYGIRAERENWINKQA